MYERLVVVVEVDKGDEHDTDDEEDEDKLFFSALRMRLMLLTEGTFD